MMLLPYLEQQGLYDAYDQKQCACTLMAGPTADTSATGSLAGDPVTSGNAQVISTRLAVLSCPSDSGDPYIPADVPYYSIKPGSGYQGVKTNYDFSTNRWWYCNAWRRFPPPYRASLRMFGDGSACRMDRRDRRQFQHRRHGRNNLQCRARAVFRLGLSVLGDGRR